MLRAASEPTIRESSVPRAQLERVYRARLARPQAVDAIMGSERLLSDLAAYDGENVVMAVMESSDGQIGCMLLDDSASRLVACFVGRDRRVV